jgi:hypothetical protein
VSSCSNRAPRFSRFWIRTAVLVARITGTYLPSWVLPIGAKYHCVGLRCNRAERAFDTGAHADFRFESAVKLPVLEVRNIYMLLCIASANYHRFRLNLRP